MSQIEVERKQETTVRVFKDLGEMIGEAARHEDLSIAEFIDRHFRATVTRVYKAGLSEKLAELGGES